ncbi:MAG: thioredoxin domain-containing protein, partial [Planctomycetaceae bacterium]|nr:thioredoxin domain-containing protein [Planctomycetaceae bacterium]
VVERIRSASRREPSPDALTQSVIDEAVVGLARVFDPANGGFGSAPKFPPSTVLPFMVERVTQHRDAMHVREMLEMTLTRMADGGLHDHVGGGFHRYCVDDVWVVPHFEKMLYDNALLAQAYTLAHVHSGDPRWRSVAERTLDFLMREMMVGDGFAASQDADAPGGEGAFFVWTPAQLDELLPPQQATAIGLRYGVTEDGNFAGGRTVLTVARPMELVTH